MASRKDDASAAQHDTPARDKLRKTGHSSSANKTDTPPQTPDASASASASTPALAISPLSFSSLPTPPSSGRPGFGSSYSGADRQHRRPAAAFRATRAFLSSSPSPLSPPAAPSPPTSPPSALRRLASPMLSSAAAAAAATEATTAATEATTAMPATPRISRSGTPEIAQIPTNQAFCDCCDDNDRHGPSTDDQGKQQGPLAATSGQGRCAVHGGSQAVQNAVAQTSHHPPGERASGSLNKVEAQLQAARAYMMRRRQAAAQGSGSGSQHKN
ncbi:uncharacterized protein SPSK_07817 [Sporothrix schenckii 1099-18]|uniref:Uncharacterized protein n=1 Tax=Sporothrix schenckii 1099-18 TaxID=1397361 RepID=A0A0F2MEU8_SPOSC|nr:uncharacterized protein SPSK_07817 [Sporothrix schenckii 1099-18]KJR88213.1 hypothetical protein SPSK_07817 [Sporothrix schenckii 1099-18]